MMTTNTYKNNIQYYIPAPIKKPIPCYSTYLTIPRFDLLTLTQTNLHPLHFKHKPHNADRQDSCTADIRCTLINNNTFRSY